MCRIFFINPYGLGLDSNSKIEQIRKKTKSEEINLWLFSSYNRKWDSYMNAKMERKMKVINLKVNLVTSDSRYNITSKTN